MPTDDFSGERVNVHSVPLPVTEMALSGKMSGRLLVKVMLVKADVEVTVVVTIVPLLLSNISCKNRDGISAGLSFTVMVMLSDGVCQIPSTSASNV